MKFVFKSIDPDTVAAYLAFWKMVPQKSSDYSSGVLLCWEKALGYQFAFEESEELVWIRGKHPDEHYLAPVGRWDRGDWKELLTARFGQSAHFRLVPERLVEIWKNQMGKDMEIIEDRGSWEYLHEVNELAELSGNKYMRKRNRINHFIKQTPYRYIPIGKEELPRIAEFQKAWCESYRIFKNADSIENESRGILENILGNWDRLPQMMGGALEVFGRIIAYTIAEEADEKTVMIHFEKASLEYGAAYQVINREFLIHEGSRYVTVNREEDMGDPSLRDAKMSYHPSDFLKKYTVNIKL